MTALATKLTFNPKTHSYFVDDKRVPGVSEILKTIGLSKSYVGVDPFYKERGIAVHRAIELYLQNNLDESSIDPILKPFFAGFLKYWEKYGTQPIAIEKMLYSPLYGFAGTLDLVAHKILDWKCSKSHDPVAEIQGMLYQQLWVENYDQILPFSVIQLPGDGTYQEFEYERNTDLLISVITLYQWKIK